VPKSLHCVSAHTTHNSKHCLEEIRNIQRHLNNLRGVKLLNITKVTDITFGQKVNGHTLTTKPTRTSNTVNVVLTVRGQIKVDDQRDLLDVNTTRQQIRRDQHARRTGAKLAHDDITLALVHVSVHARDGEIALLHFFLEPVDLASGVAVDDSLRDGERLVEIAQGLELPLFALDRNVELLDTFQGQFVLLDQDADGFAHEAFRHFEHVQGHGGREKADLHCFRKELENVVNLVLETARKHLIGFVQEELLDAVEAEGPAVDHVVDATGGSNDNVDASLEGTNVITDGGSSDAGVNGNVHVIAEGEYDLLDLLGEFSRRGQDEGLAFLQLGVQLGQRTNGKGSGFSLLLKRQTKKGIR